MDRFRLRQQVLERLAVDLLQAEQAAQAAHETATHEENIAENKYDTLGLEAAYLATGQARRAEAIRQALAHWRQFHPGPCDASQGIQLGALVCLVDADEKQQLFFLGPDGGSMTLVSGDQRVQVISSAAPLGCAMLGKWVGDEVSIPVALVRCDAMALVYSTEHGRTCPGCRQPLAACVCKAAMPHPAGDGIARVSREKQGRSGKTVTVVRGLPLDAIALTATGKQLRAACGAGGTAKDGVIEVQGDHVERVLSWLTQAGHRVKRAGG